MEVGIKAMEADMLPTHEEEDMEVRLTMDIGIATMRPMMATETADMEEAQDMEVTTGETIEVEDTAHHTLEEDQEVQGAGRLQGRGTADLHLHVVHQDHLEDTNKEVPRLVVVTLNK